jgi:hypothetical protein
LPRPQASVPARGSCKGKSARNYFPRFKPRNPLKSLDSDERIQGNPRQSNAHERVFWQRNGHKPRKSKPNTLSAIRGDGKL